MVPPDSAPTRLFHPLPTVVIVLLSLGKAKSIPEYLRKWGEIAIATRIFGGNESMGEFFRGWRRKIGVATLVMALAFVGLWGRSQISQDRIVMPVGDQLESDPYWEYEVTLDKSELFFGREKTITDPEHFVMIRDDSGALTRRYGRSTTKSGFMVPYWPIITSLTLLSAFLLLVPRKSTQKIVTESLTENVARASESKMCHYSGVFCIDCGAVAQPVLIETLNATVFVLLVLIDPPCGGAQ